MAKLKRVSNFDKALALAEKEYLKQNIDRAIDYFEIALNYNPNHLNVLKNLTILYFQHKKNIDKTIFYLKRYSDINPADINILFTLASLLKQKNKIKEAIFYFEKLIKSQPDFAPGYNEIGLCYKDLNQLEKAIFYFEEGIKKDPNLPQLYNNLGSCLGILGEYQKEVGCYQKAISLAPNYAAAWTNLGVALQHLGKNQEAINCFKKAIEYQDDVPDFYYNLGVGLKNAGFLKEAIENFNKAKSINPSDPKIYDALYLTKRQACDWENLEEIEKKLDEFGVEDPYTSIMRTEDKEKNLKAALNWSKKIKDKAKFQFKNYHPKSKKITIGYLSADIRDHPVGQMVSSMFQYHNRHLFKTIIFSYGEDDGSFYLKQAKEGADEFIDLFNVGNEKAAKIIHDKKTDILIDLMGHTLNNRLEICAYKPAPIQITWLGFPGTTGADFFNYVLVDETIVPKEDQKFFSEKLIHLPFCYQINNFEGPKTEKKFSRKDFGLFDDNFVLASFIQSYKIEPSIWNVWMEILKKTKDSVLWLWEKDKEASLNLKKEAEKRGVDPKRLIFSPSLPKEEHLKRLELADLALDTLIYGAHVTATDFLWSQVPVVSLFGKHFASRIGVSLLKETQIEEMIVYNLDEYQQKVIDLYQNREKLKKIKEKITKEKLKTNLFNTKRFVSYLEKIFIGLYQKQ